MGRRRELWRWRRGPAGQEEARKRLFRHGHETAECGPQCLGQLVLCQERLPLLHVAGQGLDRRPAAAAEDVEDGVEAEEILCAAAQTRRVRRPLELLVEACPSVSSE